MKKTLDIYALINYNIQQKGYMALPNPEGKEEADRGGSCPAPSERRTAVHIPKRTVCIPFKLLLRIIINFCFFRKLNFY